MASVIGWLDHSEEQQRRMREVIDLFSETDSRDELGIGAVRDAFSDLLFPGLSTIQTRARYFFFIPWVYLELEGQRVPAGQIGHKAKQRQTQLIYALEAGGESEGVIGIDAREDLKRLADTVYWNGLGVFDLRRYQGGLGDYRRNIGRFYRQVEAFAGYEAEQIDIEQPTNWHPALPAQPDELFSKTTLTLTVDEAHFLRERIVTADPGSLLAHYLLAGQPVEDTIALPWDGVDFNGLPDELAKRVRYGRWFSELFWGAALLYNFLLAKEATHRELQSGGVERVEHYQDRLDDWAALVTARRSEFEAVQRDDFWRLVSHSGARVTAKTRQFLDQWFDVALKPGESLATNTAVHQLIGDREQDLKRGLARLSNPRQLEIWGGVSGAGQLNYRWGTARVIINDIIDGLADA
jgi:hypothetical protein